MGNAGASVMGNATSTNPENSPSGLSGAMVVVALAIGGGLALIRRPSTAASEEDKENSGAIELPKSVPIELPKPVPVEQIQEEASPATEKAKKKRKKKAKEGVEPEEPPVEEPLQELQELDPPEDMAFEGEGGWTEVQKRRTGVDANDEQAQRRADKILDLRRRKVAIAQKLGRVEEGLGGHREDKECKTLEVRARLLEDLNRVNASMKRLSEATAATTASEPLHGVANDQNPPESTPEPEEIKDDTLLGYDESEDVGDGNSETGAWSSWGASDRQWWHDDAEWENNDWQQATGGWSESGGAHVYRPAGARRRRRGLGGASEAAWQWNEDGEQGEPIAGDAATSSATPRGRWAEEEDEEEETAGGWTAYGNDDRRYRWQAVAKEGSEHMEIGERRIGKRKGAGKGARGGRGGSRRMMAVAEDWVEEQATTDPSATTQATKPTRRWQPTQKENAEAIVESNDKVIEETVREQDCAGAAKETAASMLGAKPGKRPNWGDADSEDEDQLVATAGCVERTGGRWVDSQRSAVQAPKSRRAFDPDLVAFMGEDALKDEGKFEEQLKYVPQWVAEKARSLRHVMFPRDREPSGAKGRR